MNHSAIDNGSPTAVPTQALVHRTLEDIASQYERSEITAIWIHSRATNRHSIVFSVVELCPFEQPSSDLFVSQSGEKTWPHLRRSLDSDRTVYAARLVDLSPTDGIRFYRGSGGLRSLELSTGAVVLETFSALNDEPPDEYPVLVAEKGTDIYENVLPVRPTDLRVCSKFTRSDLEICPEGLIQKLWQFVNESIGIDLNRFQEHVGAIHLCMSNPIIRNMGENLGEDPKELILKLYPRLGMSLDGCKIALVDHRPGGIGFDVAFEVSQEQMVLPLPSDPQELETRFYGPNGELLGFSRAHFLREIRTQMGIGGRQRRIETKKADGQTTVETVSVVSWDGGAFGEQDRAESILQKLEVARGTRRDVREAGSFQFFSGGPAERDRARQEVRRMLGSARVRCMLCDPYLTADDVYEYATFATTSGLQIRLLAAARYLREKSEQGPVQGQRLLERITSLSTQDPSLRLVARVLKGRQKSPVHDRFLMLDDAVYILGSSLAEFGSRATTLYRAPAGANLLAVLEDWWINTAISQPLDEWMSGTAGGDEE